MQQSARSAPGATIDPSPAMLTAETHLPAAAPLLAGWTTLIGLRLKGWGYAWVAASEAAALYQELSKLSDAQLEHRGIPRGELHRCVSAVLDRPTAGGRP
jgi:hypothetical protein